MVLKIHSSEVCILAKCSKHTLFCNTKRRGEMRLFKIRGAIYKIPIYSTRIKKEDERFTGIVWIISIDFREKFQLSSGPDIPSSCCATRSQSRLCRLSLMLRCLAWVTPPRDSLVMSHDKITHNLLLYVVY